MEAYLVDMPSRFAVYSENQTDSAKSSYISTYDSKMACVWAEGYAVYQSNASITNVYKYIIILQPYSLDFVVVLHLIWPRGKCEILGHNRLRIYV